MKNLEKQLLNTIENAMNYMMVFHKEYQECPIHNGFTLLVEHAQISLIDQDIVVAVFNRGYIQLSQMIPLIADIIQVWGEPDEDIVIH